MPKMIEEVPGLYRIIKMDMLRKTVGVTFDSFPIELAPQIGSIERVLHTKHALSPGPVGDVARPWYMHYHQDDYLMVLHGQREVELYNAQRGNITRFLVTPEAVYRDSQLVCSGGIILNWPRNVFHRITSGEHGSASINVGVHYPDYDIRHNFDIYDLNLADGTFWMIKNGYEDQFGHPNHK